MTPKTRRTNISIPESLYEAAQAQIHEHLCSGFSDYIAHLIRSDIEKHRDTQSAQVSEPAESYTAPSKRKRKPPPAVTNGC